MRRTIGVTALLLVLVFGVRFADAQRGAFVARLSGQEAVPPTNSAATGLAVFQPSSDGTRLFYRLEVRNLENTLMAHIHLGRPGQSGPVVVWLYPYAPPPRLISGVYSGVLATGTITAANLAGPMQGKPLSELLTEIQNGNAYVNVHTSRFPAGEIRGQIQRI
ncbi:MAG: CHRD domain-containing protein [Armatimonadota bacterium]|nr:CHRD domain-containing protein [Armatimonadota bacterium]MDR5702181.1 CHRD domain-containing protein [Armatimonadota bacterium]MDR7433931.1 CHRD domain-containing protein [Armatimonadota bacterium]